LFYIGVQNGTLREVEPTFTTEASISVSVLTVTGLTLKLSGFFTMRW